MDQNNSPVLLAGDAAHGMFASLNATDLATYLGNRQGHGFNIVWAEALCTDYISECRSDMSTFDGIKPFTSGTDKSNYDISTPNPAYWSRVDSYVNLAATYGITVLFDTWETGALMPLARASGSGKMRSFGAFLGSRYKNFPNIIWITGNDFQTWRDPTDNALMQSLMAGIGSADSNHLQTTELDYYASGSLDDALLAPLTTLSGAYDYYCSYGMTLAQYNHANPAPVFYEEGYYEFNDNILGNVTTPLSLRTQAWWAALAGATAGQVWGSGEIYPFRWDWPSHADTAAVSQFAGMNSFLRANHWYNLVPDQDHVVVTAGYGTQDVTANNDCINSNDYVTTAYAPDGSTSISYDPRGTALTVDLSRFRGRVTARWYDPANGSFTPDPGSPYNNSGSHVFSTPGGNSDGDSDWVLVLTAP